MNHLLEAAKAAMEAIQKNHEWHQTYDEHGGYPDSELCIANENTIPRLRAAIQEAEAERDAGKDEKGLTVEEVAQVLWHRFAPEHHIDWADEVHKAEYIAAAEAILYAAPPQDRDAERLDWLANRVLACDYGDSSAGQIGWRIRADLPQILMYGESISAAIDAAMKEKP
jgi:hypothetical protein